MAVIRGNMSSRAKTFIMRLEVKGSLYQPETTVSARLREAGQLSYICIFLNRTSIILSVLSQEAEVVDDVGCRRGMSPSSY